VPRTLRPLPTDPEGQWGLRVLLSPDPTRSGRAFALDESLVVGRSGRDRLVFADPRMSRQHVLLQRQGPVFGASDLSSKNGTTVNGDTITRVSLHQGDLVRAGDTLMLFGRLDIDLPLPKVPDGTDADTLEARILGNEPETAEEARPQDPREALIVALTRCKGNVSEVARLLGSNRKQVYRWLKRHDLDPKAYR
jgi:pSer/pThr/pTyr-binding forkhead associated (FHA) protein